ncbi:V-type ATPase subunit [Chloroflexota bacterium]
MLDTGYPFLSAYLKGEEARLITSDHINRMSKVSDIQDVLEIIKDTDIGSYFEGVLVKTFDDLDESLWMYFRECLEHVEWFKPVPADILKVLKTYIVKYDVLNIKATLQGISTGKQACRIPIGIIYNHGLLDELFAAENVDGIIELLTKCKLGSYAPALEEYKIDGGLKSRLLAEARLDGEYYSNLLNITKRIKDGTLLSKVLAITIDMKNLQIMLRAIIAGIGPEAAGYVIDNGYILSGETTKELLPLKLSDIPGKLANTQYRNVAEEVIGSYEKIKSIVVIEEIIEKHKFRLSKEILSPRVLSPLIIAWYLILKEVEIRNLRLVLKATFDNVPIEEIKNYLVFSS